MKSPFSVTAKYNRLIILIGAVLLLAILISALLIAPAWSKLKQVGSEIPQIEGKQKQAEANVTNLKKAKEFFDNNQQILDQVNTALPVQPEVPEVLVILDALAKSDGVTLTSFSPQQVGGTTGTTPGAATQQAAGSAGSSASGSLPAGVNTLEVTANYSGTYQSLIRFMYDLERNLRIVDVKSISFAGESGSSAPAVGTSQSSGASTVLRGTITFRVYYKPSSTNAAPTTTNPGASPAPTASPSGGGR